MGSVAERLWTRLAWLAGKEGVELGVLELAHAELAGLIALAQGLPQAIRPEGHPAARPQKLLYPTPLLVLAVEIVERQCVSVAEKSKGGAAGHASRLAAQRPLLAGRDAGRHLGSAIAGRLPRRGLPGTLSRKEPPNQRRLGAVLERRRGQIEQLLPC